MLFNFGLKSSILLIFFVHGLVYSFLLWKRGIQESDTSSKWLAAFVALCALYVVPFMLGYAGWYAHDGYRETLFFIPFQQVLLLGPVLFFYARSLMAPGKEFARTDWIHFLPALVYLAYSLFIWLVDVFVLDAYYFYADGRDKDLKFWYQALGWLSMVAYLLASLDIYRLYLRESAEWVSFADAIRLEWMRNFLLAFLLILILRMLFFILNPEWGEFGRKFWFYLCFSALYYYIAITGYAQTVRNAIALSQSDVPADLPDPETALPQNDFGPGELERWKVSIDQAFTNDRLHEQPTLTLAQLARTLQLPPKTLSAAINQGFDMNFNDLVNSYRVKAMSAKLTRGEQERKTLLALAYECGFNSKATFNRAFKKHTGMTPGQFMKTLAHE